MFDPKTDRYPYPEFTDRHYLVNKVDRGIVFDCGYPYLDSSRGFRFRQFLVRVLLYIIVFPVARVRYGLKINGRENLKKHRDIIRKGLVSCSNHINMWDYIFIMSAVRPHRTNVLSWAANINGKDGPLIRLVGGIPIPDRDPAAIMTSMKKTIEHIKNGGWVHLYAEGSMWEYYATVRPFKPGTAHLACDAERPVLPIGFSYREPGWIRRKVFRQIACITLSIGEPVFPDPALPKMERITDLTVRCHQAVCRLAGIDPEENIYPPVFDDTRRVDYYTTEYGVGYRP